MRDEDRYRAIVERAPDAVWLLDAGHRITYVNPAGAEMLGLAPAEIVGHAPADFVDPDVRSTLELGLARRRSGATDRYDLTLRRADGAAVPVEVSATPLFDEHGIYAGSAAIMVDATERRQLAHDLNNLLAVIANHAHYVQRKLPEDAALRGDVAEIGHAATRASELAARLLTSIPSDPPPLRVLDVNALVGGAERLMRNALGDGVELTTDLSDEPCRVRADAAQLEHALLNLALNARDAMAGAGAIEIATRCEDEQVFVTVTDDGPGMEPNVAARAFEPYFTTKPAGEGAGLGLATVHSTVAAAGGTVEVDSEPGGGTVVRLTLPAA